MSAARHEQSCDLAIVGAGPAGLAAAQVAREHGLHIVIIDEQWRAGGQILRQPPRTFAVDDWLTAGLYRRAKGVLRAVEEQRDIEWRFGSAVLGVQRPSAYRTRADDCHHELWIRGPEFCSTLRARAVLVAPGCYERPLAFPGWTLPGVMGAGALQGFLKAQQLIPGRRFVFAGSHPLQLVAADQLASVGAEVAAVIFTQQPRRALAMLRRPVVALQNTAPLMETARILQRLRRARVRLLFGATVAAAHGREVVERVTIAAVDLEGALERKRTFDIECDRLGVCHGFLASSELARQCGARVQWREHEGGWVVTHDAWYESSVPRVFVAGEITGVAGADAALERGRIAAIGVLRALARIESNEAERLARSARRRLARIERFASTLNALARPPARLDEMTMTEDAILCRCESISRGEFERELQANPHVLSADAAKLLTRVGMGLCQGRLCGANAVALIARLRGVSPADVGPFHAQAPIKPAPVDILTRQRCDGGNEPSQPL